MTSREEKQQLVVKNRLLCTLLYKGPMSINDIEKEIQCKDKRMLRKIVKEQIANKRLKYWKNKNQIIISL